MLRKFWQAEGGNMAIITAVCASALLGATGAAVDFVRQYDADTAYAAAADAAVLSGAALIREHIDWSSSKIVKEAKAEVQKSWKANLTSDLLANIKKPEIEVSYKGSEWTVAVGYKGEMKTSMLGVIGIKKMAIKGKAVSAVGQNQTHWQFNFAIDTSSSMGIGATQADMDNMQADPSIGCMFACHYSSTGDDTMGRARIGGYKLRLDVVDDAVDNTISIISAKSSIKPTSALYGMTNDLTELVPETDKLNDVKNHKIEIAYTAISIGNTNYRATLEQLTDKIGEAGDGTSADKPRKVVFIVTDGIHDTTYMEPNVEYVWYADHQLGTLDPKYCDTMKNDGVLVGVLYVNYIVPAGYEGTISSYEDKILPNMKACASEGFFYNATAVKDLKPALADMLAKAFNSDVRLTQ